MTAKSLAIAATLAALCLTTMNVVAGDKARIDRAAAEKTALARVPGGEIKEGELETENGKLVWSIEIARKTSADITEVQVDAMTGEVVSVENDSADDQDEEHEAGDKDDDKDEQDHK
jgi:hypothetical protein